jgi:hypothetical protein
MDYRILKLEETIEIVQVPDYEMASFLVWGVVSEISF